MIVSAAQPYFCPYPGYFARAAASDVFVILDTVQFPRGSTWITRNRFKNDQGTYWLSIPVQKKGLGLQRIGEVRICPQPRMQKKHLESIVQAYRHAPYLDEHYDFLQGLLCSEHETILSMNMQAIAYVMSCLEIGTRIVPLSGLPGVEGKGSSLIAGICRNLSANRYLAPGSACHYLEEEAFEREGVGLTPFRYQGIVYPQLWGDFIPNLSIFDLLLNCGKKAKEMMRKQMSGFRFQNERHTSYT